MCSEIIQSKRYLQNKSKIQAYYNSYDRTEGFLLSPWYPQEYAENSVGQCFTTIIVKEHMKISLQVIEFNLPENAYCGNDRLEVSGRRENISSWVHMYSWCGKISRQSSASNVLRSTGRIANIYRRMSPPHNRNIDTPYSQINFVLENRPTLDNDHFGRKFKIKWTSSPVAPAHLPCITKSCKSEHFNNVPKDEHQAKQVTLIKEHSYKQLMIGMILLILIISGLQCACFHLHKAFRKYLTYKRCLALFGWLNIKKRKVANSTCKGSATKDVSDSTTTSYRNQYERNNVNSERILSPEDMHFRKPIPKELLELTIYGANNVLEEADNGKKQQSYQLNSASLKSDQFSERITTDLKDIDYSIDLVTIKNLVNELTEKIEKEDVCSTYGNLNSRRVYNLRFNPLTVISKSSCPYQISKYV
ncbi:hypothetical protein GJ496_002789 [Pomphorhynchus laevis]|nr:hypothetical protein GJ496_002789 [Pomphorhynchus laevis]